MSEEKKRCHDADDPDVHDCLKEADPAFTMDFSDIGERTLHWCSVCGERAQAMDKLLMHAIDKLGFDQVKTIADKYTKSS